MNDTAASPKVLIIGAGHAGGSTAAFLRQYGFTGPIVLAGAEPLAPYQRPPLSKAWLKGEADAESLALKPEAFYPEHNIELRLGLIATRINREARTVTFASGEVLDYDILVIATGARARRLSIPGADLAGILELRTAADAEALKAALVPGAKLAVVGGGYVGLEAAASARALGAEAVVIEREARVLARVASPPISTFYTEHHRSHGVEVILDASVVGFSGEDGRVTGVELADGRHVACDVALVGVGGMANVEIARDAGLSCVDGITVDMTARTDDPAIFAVGDVTHRPLPLYDRAMRLESVPNALEQAKQAASAIAGHAAPPEEVPWFWSDQYDLKLQIAGVPFDADELVIRGDDATGGFAVFHLQAGQVLAVEAINAPSEFMGGRLLVQQKKVVDPMRLADSAVTMKQIVAR
jgi:3-phenylpropionate/trans-cinnamate dioxygenase ferredoxin reductase component